MATTGMFILRSAVSIGKQPNHTTVSRPTSQPGISIEMSFVAERPPIPSKLFVHCPNLDRHFHEKPLILAMVDDFFLVRAVMVWPGRLVICEDLKYDYFVYNPTLGILDQLPPPHPLVFYPNQVGLLPRGDHYTVAALVPPTRNPFTYQLHLFNSDAAAGSWKSKSVPVSTRLRRFPIEIPNSCLLRHQTSDVITIGGEDGTMGWVDLWRDVLLCDVLCPYPELNTVHLPLPLKQINSNETVLGYARTCRGVAYVEADSCLKFVEIHFDHSLHDDKTGSPVEVMADWTVKTSTNTNMTNWWDDWDDDFQAEAKDTEIGSEFSQLISEQHCHRDGAVVEPTLRDLFVFQPALSIDDKQVVYLLTSGQFGGDHTWVLAIDLKNKTLVDVAKLRTKPQLFSPAIYCRGTLKSIIDLLLKVVFSTESITIYVNLISL